MEETYLLKGKRNQLVALLKQKKISDTKVLAAIGKIKRHLFVGDSAFYDHAYDDKAFPISAKQTISQPYTVAVQSSLLDIQPFEKVLEIGTGSGYQTAILEALKARVFSIERQKQLFDETKKLAKKLNLSAKLFYGDGYKGLPNHAPFNKIIVTAGAEYIPKPLIDQLAIKGKMVIPVSQKDSDIQIMKIVVKNSENTLDIKSFGQFKFVPLLRNKGSEI